MVPIAEPMFLSSSLNPMYRSSCCAWISWNLASTVAIASWEWCAAVCTANGIPRLKDRRVDSCVVIVWAYFCWRDGGGLVIAIFSLTFGMADFCGCRVFGGLQVAGQNDRGG
ncbi:hypothetical protein NDU88_003610 [Pleurodeles waltl]|uniref:Uncharacterized protein n=1 Tax=Pleurodeles waltl TaxID=8319 RepID=A0AAV7WPL4_PLEWA|nr:hypothetical protein NDU88_003610 [Pleurodeles waltl]